MRGGEVICTKWKSGLFLALGSYEERVSVPMFSFDGAARRGGTYRYACAAFRSGRGATDTGCPVLILSGATGR